MDHIGTPELTDEEKADWFAGRLVNYGGHGQRPWMHYEHEFELVTGTSTDPTFGTVTTHVESASSCRVCGSVVTSTFYSNHADWHRSMGQTPKEKPK